MPSSWLNPRTEEWEDFEPIIPTCEVEDNPVIGQLLGPDESVLVEVRERPTVPFGFHGVMADG